MSVDHPWTAIEEALGRTCEAFDAGKLRPVLAEDVAGYMYYLLVSRAGGDADRIHLNARVAGAPDHERFSLVLGGLQSPESQTDVVLPPGEEPQTRRKPATRRPSIGPELVLEFVVLTGMPAGPRHYRQEVADRVLGSVRRLEVLARECPNSRGLVICDPQGSLNVRQLQDVLKRQLNDDPSLCIYVVRPTAGTVQWRLLEGSGRLRCPIT